MFNKNNVAETPSCDFNQLELKSLKQVTACFSIVTPMYLGGANNRPDGIRPSSVFSVLRFWWRAIHWSTFMNENKSDTKAALIALHKEEARIFGASAKEIEEDGKKKHSGGQGIFDFQVLNNPQLSIKQHNAVAYSGLAYLCGQGLNNRQYYAPLENAFELILDFKPHATVDRDIAQVTKAIKAFGLLGGLGSRSRHGLGQVALTKLNDENFTLSLERYKALVVELLGKDCEINSQNLSLNSDPLPPYTALTQHVRYSVSEPFKWLISKDYGQAGGAISKTGDGILDVLGFGLGRYRLYGKYNSRANPSGHIVHQGMGKWEIRSLKKFKDDHDQMENMAKGHAVNELPKRMVFGLPHNYFFSSPKYINNIAYRGFGISIPSKKNNIQRRSSPLFFHVHQIKEEGESDVNYTAVRFLIPAEFLPEPQVSFSRNRSVKTQDNTRVTLDPLNKTLPFVPDWTVITQYLNVPLEKHVK